MINVIYEQVCVPILTLCWENVALEWMTEEGRSRRVFRALEIKLIKLSFKNSAPEVLDFL